VTKVLESGWKGTLSMAVPLVFIPLGLWGQHLGLWSAAAGALIAIGPALTYVTMVFSLELEWIEVVDAEEAEKK
jgi:hypothetical protein